MDPKDKICYFFDKAAIIEGNLIFIGLYSDILFREKLS